MSTEAKSPSLYCAYVDGLRAIAVLVVLFFHADIGFSGGYVGVDVFFVISGYLITGLILKDLDAGRFKILEFWERRVRRILPAVALVTVACLATGWFLYHPHNFKELGKSAVAQVMLVSNFYFWQKSGYFEPAAGVKPLLHTWSLAVEEQFYLLFPFLLVALQRLRRESLVPAILLLCGLSFSLSVYCSYVYPSVNFYLLPTRAWELLIGAFLGAIPRQRASARGLSESLSWGGFLAISYAALFYDRETRFPGATALLPCVGTAFVIWANGHTLTSLGKLLSARPIVFIGLISYSLYLWHWPVLMFSEYWMLGAIIPIQHRMLLLLGSMVLSVLSWKFVETPFRKRVILTSRPGIFTFAVVTTAVLLFAGLAISRFDGLAKEIPAAAMRFIDRSTEANFYRNSDLMKVKNSEFDELGIDDKREPIRLFVWGDSHAQAVLPVIDLLCKEYSVRGVSATLSSTVPLVGYGPHWSMRHSDARDFNNSVVEFIRSKQVDNVLIVARWNKYIGLDKGTQQLRSGMVFTINALHGSGTRIWIMRDVPEHRYNVPDALVSAVVHDRDPNGLGLPLAEHRKEQQRQDPIFEGLSTDFFRVSVLDPTYIFVNSSNLCRVTDGGNALYSDTHHLSVAGAMLLRPLMRSIFDKHECDSSTRQ